MSDDSPLDAKTLAMLRGLSGPDAPDLHIQLAHKYIAGARDAVARLTVAAAAGDVAPAREAAHELKGSSGNVGAMTLFELADGVEQEALAGRLDPDAIARVGAELERVVAAFEQAFEFRA